MKGADVTSTGARGQRILHVIDGIGVGGAELVLVRLVEELQRLGHHNVIVSLTEPGHLAKRLTTAGAVVESLGFVSGRLPGPVALRLGAAFRRHRPNVVQGWMYHGNLAAIAGCWMAGRRAIPLAWSVHNTIRPRPRPDFRWHTRAAIRLGAFLSGHVAAIVYVAAASAEQHEEFGYRRDPRVVIPNGVDCDCFRPNVAGGLEVRAALGVPDGVPLVGLFARWDPWKGHAILFEAARRLLDEGQSLHLVLAGSGIESGNRALARALDDSRLRPHVSLLRERDDIERWLAGLDVFALPSICGEAFPLALVEAMAVGVPCIATDIGDCAWIIDDTGFVVPPDDVTALATVLRRLLRSVDERARLGGIARRRVIKLFSLAESVRRYEALYVRVCADVLRSRRAP